MRLIVYYIAIMLILNVATVLIGFAVESQFGSVVSLIVFLSLYFSTLWAAWRESGVADQANGRDRPCGRRRESISLLPRSGEPCETRRCCDGDGAVVSPGATSVRLLIR